MTRTTRIRKGGVTGIDLTGQVFGGLTVLAEDEPVRRRDENGRVRRTMRRWRCECSSCGRTDYLIEQHNLMRQAVRSCGCARTTHGMTRRDPASRQEARRSHPAFALWNAAKARTSSRGKGHEFSLTVEQVAKMLEETTVCPVLGITLETAPKEKKRYWDCSPSIDRIDSSKGYTPENVWIVSARANRIKSDATLEELRMLVKALENRLA